MAAPFWVGADQLKETVPTEPIAIRFSGAAGARAYNEWASDEFDPTP